MIFERSASLEEVLRACPDHEPTKDIVRKRNRFGLWSADLASIASIGAQLPQAVTTIGIDRPHDGLGTIATLFAAWMRWVSSAAPQAARDAASHAHFIALLRSGGTFETAPIVLGESRQIHDGRHRLFATFHVLTTEDSGRSFGVFWDRV